MCCSSSRRVMLHDRQHGDRDVTCKPAIANRVFSLTWPASMEVYWNKRERLHKKRVQLPEDWFGTPTWPPFHCFGTPIWPPWRHVKTLYRPLPHSCEAWGGQNAVEPLYNGYCGDGRKWLLWRGGRFGEARLYSGLYEIVHLTLNLIPLCH